MSQKTITLPASAAEPQPGTFDRPADATSLYRHWGAHLVEGGVRFAPGDAREWRAGVGCRRESRLR